MHIQWRCSMIKKIMVQLYIILTREGFFKKKHSCGFILFKTVLYTDNSNTNLFH